MHSHIIFAVHLQICCKMFLCSFHFIVARFCWFLVVFRAVMAATERGKRNVGFLLLLAFSDGSQRAEVCFERLC